MNHKAFVEAFFAFEHLPPHLRAVSAPFAVLARDLVASHVARNAALAEADHAAVMRKLGGASFTDGRTPLAARAEAHALADAEITSALRKLREAKDCAVLAAVVLAKVTP